MHGYRGEHVELLGYHDLDGMPGFKLQLQVTADDRWLLYLSRFWHPGTHILDVTDPTAPVTVGEVPAPDDPNVASWQIQVADGLLIQSLEHRPVPWGGDPSAATDEGLRIWDVHDPAAPRLLGRYRWGASGTHRNLYTGGRYVHATAAVPGVDGNVYAILDIDDPSDPVEVGRFVLPEQTAATPPPQRISLHGPPYPVGDRTYLPYGAAGVVTVDTSDPTDIREVGRLDIGAAFASTIAMHTVIPLPERRLAVVNTEAIAELTEEPYNFAGIVDIRDETAPRLVSLLPPPVPDAGAPYPNFNRRGGRFGPHNQHHHQGHPHLLQDDRLVHLTWFNAGLRIYDTSDPYLPREVAWFLPDDPTERRGPLPRTALVTQSEDVLVDVRGVIYLTDKNHGLHLLRASI
jgi:hypothetical protein